MKVILFGNEDVNAGISFLLFLGVHGLTIICFFTKYFL